MINTRSEWEKQPSNHANLTAETKIGEPSIDSEEQQRFDAMDKTQARMEYERCYEIVASVMATDGYDGTNYYEQMCVCTRIMIARIAKKFPEIVKESEKDEAIDAIVAHAVECDEGEYTDADIEEMAEPTASSTIASLDEVMDAIKAGVKKAREERCAQ